MELKYFYPYKEHAIKCLQAGYKNNAASWMNKYLLEIGPEHEVDPDSLKLINGELYYKTLVMTKSCVDAEGI